jgi:hypothetical protein
LPAGGPSPFHNAERGLFIFEAGPGGCERPDQRRAKAAASEGMVRSGNFSAREKQTPTDGNWSQVGEHIWLCSVERNSYRKCRSKSIKAVHRLTTLYGRNPFITLHLASTSWAHDPSHSFRNRKMSFRPWRSLERPLLVFPGTAAFARHDLHNVLIRLGSSCFGVYFSALRSSL